MNARSTWLIAAAIMALALLPIVTGGTYYPYLGIIVFIYGIVAIGLNILSGYAGQFSLGHAAFMAMGAYTTAILTKYLNTTPLFAQTGLHIWLGVVCGTVLAALSTTAGAASSPTGRRACRCGARKSSWSAAVRRSSPWTSS